jgi:alkylation response protein AidB-like acyl-CoA dehydrogenase
MTSGGWNGSATAVADDAATILRAQCRDAGEDIGRCLDLAQGWGRLVPLPGSGGTAGRFRLLAAAAEGDVTAARVLEPHLDALAILAEAAEGAWLAEQDGVWGVFAAEAPGVLLTADQGPHGWTVSGTKPWCSLAGRLDRALVTAHTDTGRSLFAVDLRHPGVTAHRGTWISRGLRQVDSGPVDFAAVPCVPVGASGWYLRRPGFAWGAIGVAACWDGAAVGLVRTLVGTLARRPELDRILAMNLGVADAALFAARACLEAAAAVIDSPSGAERDDELLAHQVRAGVAGAAEDVLKHVGHALGPAPLAFDEPHARRVADLEIYLRQHHGERDLAELGARALDSWRSTAGQVPPPLGPAASIR